MKISSFACTFMYMSTSFVKIRAMPMIFSSRVEFIRFFYPRRVCFCL